MIIVCLAFGAARADDALSKYPILSIPESAGVDALLRHPLTREEHALFDEIEAETAKLPADANPARYHDMAVKIGKRSGLTYAQGIAFFVRTTFSQFEP